MKKPNKKRPFTRMGEEANRLLQLADKALAESADSDRPIDERQLLALQGIGASLMALVHIQTRGDLL